MKSLLVTLAFCLVAGSATASTTTLDMPTAKSQSVESPFIGKDIVMKSGDKIKCKGCTIIIIK